MAHCEDFPCCGHEMGCCPDFDPVTGAQLNMKCVCGATVPLGGSSLCQGCLGSPYDEHGNYDPMFGYEEDWHDLGDDEDEED